MIDTFVPGLLADGWLLPTPFLVVALFCAALVAFLIFLILLATGDTTGLAVNSTPSAGRATRARILFQVLMTSARGSIHITSPNFLPDRSGRGELLRARWERGVSVKVLTAGSHSYKLLNRRVSRRVYRELLRAGVEIHKFQPSMMRAKVMVADRVWAVVGSTNFSNRSFGHNDELKLAARDLARSHHVTLEEWLRRPLWERATECLSRVLDRQQ